VAKLLLAKPLVEKTTENLKKRCEKLKEGGITPCIKVILVGEDPASKVYTRSKKRLGEKIGADAEIVNLPDDVSVEEFTTTIAKHNSDKNVHGLMVQLPVPSQLSGVDIQSLISPEKDVDGATEHSLASIILGSKGENSLLPCTPSGIISLLKFYNIELVGKNVVIIGRSLIVGKPLAMLMTNYNATVTLCHSRTSNLMEHTQNADIIVTAIGQNSFLKACHIKEGQTIIDVGINRNSEGKLCGDVDFDAVEPIVSAITPVPGGVGPLTVLSLAQNLIETTEKNFS
jgi:methylenetetrahydrofolate dehydrogenase (NADP+) / methenyltetrahydrofolate cyclohydrolase